ncbi:hypothetical protein N9D95_03310, partial [Flavobacteriales bacterium]|nr:hypothetical protein [Flavobacteriales bacterium]
SSILPALLTNALDPLQLGSAKPARTTAVKSSRDLKEGGKKEWVFMIKEVEAEGNHSSKDKVHAKRSRATFTP